MRDYDNQRDLITTIYGTNDIVEDVKKVVCDYYGLTSQQLTGSSRMSAITTPRFIAIYLCRSMLNMTFEDMKSQADECLYMAKDMGRNCICANGRFYSVPKQNIFTGQRVI